MATGFYLQQATLDDLDAMIKIIDEAKVLLKRDHIPQWQDGHPNADYLKRDLKQHASYVLVDAYHRVVGTVALVEGSEPTYPKIDGHWHRYQPYLTIHRIALSANVRGQHLSTLLFSNIISISLRKKIFNIRFDTHAKNIRMQKLAHDFGFQKRGIIEVADRIDPKRWAYELNL